MEDNYQISLNFLPLNIQNFSFRVYRREFQGEKRSDFSFACAKKTLPIDHNNIDLRKEYWISLEEHDEFDPFNCQADHNHYLSRDYLHNLLLERCDQILKITEFYEHKDFISQKIYFIQEKHLEGDEIISFESFFLKSASKFGFLVDFNFKKKPDIPFSKKVQQLSLSLDKYGRENKSYYVDRFNKIQEFIVSNIDKIFPLALNSEPISIEKKLLQLPAKTLSKKIYIFGNDNTHNSQFMGIKRFNPLENLEGEPKIFFIFRESDRLLSLDLYEALRGKRFPNLFPGMFKMFNINLSTVNVKGIPVSNFSLDEMIIAKNKIIDSKIDCPVIAIMIAPWNEEDKESSKEYFQAKYIFIKDKIPTQVVRVHTLEKDTRLQWSVSNIALQCFSKLGGKPWIVQAKHKNCLIIGIGQSHRQTIVNGKRTIEKYYAYSILTDSSGLFKEIKVLGKSDKKEDYLTQLKENINEIITENSNHFNNFVIHAPYKIRTYELKAIEDLIKNYSSRDDFRFIVLKINDENSFFGFSYINNSLVPYESTYIRLSFNEYLIWFEGLQFHNPKVSRRYSRPIHIAIHYSNLELSSEERINYLQDAVNLSGANWRGFNAKNLPVSIYYTQLIARFINKFDEYGLETLELDNLNPWFL